MNQNLYETSEKSDKQKMASDEYFDISRPRGRRARPWTFDQFTEECDTPGASRIQAVLAANDSAGFTLYARQNGSLHAVTHNEKSVRFRTIEQALATLTDVSYLLSEIIIDTSRWRRCDSW
ncbi:hypothetical protein [Collimonas antrihumi]|uniref:hypothetical protein n=1 Tax=Collimonas antrihumi TaxID=1940615 RepID=UPI001B8C6F32|nr:hypothetical protein [Collimonas antrihumi]